MTPRRGNLETLVSPAWLAAHRDDPKLRIVDATFKMPGVVPTAAADYARTHIPGAVFFDIDAIADHTSPLPHMLPPPAQFAAQMGALGLGSDHRIIVYDSTGLIGAARAWWMFRVFGHDAVAVLDGGLPAWRDAGFPETAAASQTAPAAFVAEFRPSLVRNKEQMLENLESRAEQVLDARAAPRFLGAVAEPWPGRRSGRIPGSLNLDHTALVDGAPKRWKSAEALADLFHAAAIDLERPIVTSCGSGITACVLALGLHLVGAPQVAVYDGSWAEWGLPGATPIAVGPEP
jgi:thiosulfate/3-mercaptopyruvate sulfurtransferase